MSNEELILKIRKADNTSDLMLELYNRNKGFIYKICSSFRQQLEIMDMMQEGYIAVCEAVQDFDVEVEDANFLQILKFKLLDHINRMKTENNIVRVPENLLHKVYLYNKYVADFEMVCHRPPNDAELCHRLNVSEKVLEQIKEHKNDVFSKSLSEELKGDTDGITLADTIPDPADNFEEVERKIDSDLFCNELNKVLKQTTKQNADIFLEHYLFKIPADEIASNHNIEERTVRPTYEKVMNMVKHSKLIRRYDRYRDKNEDTYARAYKSGINLFNMYGSTTENCAIKLLDNELALFRVNAD